MTPAQIVKKMLETVTALLKVAEESAKKADGDMAACMELCKQCADLCAKCAAACQQFPDDQTMTACAAACQTCATACQAVASMTMASDPAAAAAAAPPPPATEQKTMDAAQLQDHVGKQIAKAATESAKKQAARLSFLAETMKGLIPGLESGDTAMKVTVSDVFATDTRTTMTAPVTKSVTWRSDWGDEIPKPEPKKTANARR